MDEGVAMTMNREENIKKERERILQGGTGYDKLEKIGKLFVRERLKFYCVSVKSYYETGIFDNAVKEDLPADGVVTVTGKIDKRLTFFMASDYTVKAGSIGTYHGEKILRIQEAAIRGKRPILYLIDSSGGRIDEAGGYHVEKHSAGRIWYNHSLLSGRVPQI